LAHAALVDGFGWTLLYGGIGVWILAVLSFIVFGPGKAVSDATRPKAQSQVI
jgi:hypothetical protein